MMEYKAMRNKIENAQLDMCFRLAPVAFRLPVILVLPARTGVGKEGLNGSGPLLF